MNERARRTRWVVLAAVSAALLVAGGLALGTGLFSPGTAPVSAPPTTFGKVPVARHSPPTTANPNLIDRQPPAGKESSLLPTDGATGPTIIIPAIGVRAGIIAEGIDQTPGDVGNLSAPESANQVGWWDGGPAPGQGGTAVLTGHRVSDWAFWNLGDVQTGDTVQVIGTNGQTTNWVVSSVQQMLKTQLPPAVWTKGGSPMLALVTCGGTFNYSIGHYNDNILVWAKPAKA